MDTKEDLDVAGKSVNCNIQQQYTAGFYSSVFYTVLYILYTVYCVDTTTLYTTHIACMANVATPTETTAQPISPSSSIPSSYILNKDVHDSKKIIQAFGTLKGVCQYLEILIKKFNKNAKDMCSCRS